MSKLILTHEVSGLGSAGDVVDVRDGYARNYLIPQGFAVAWSRGGEKQVESIKAARAARELATLEEAQDLKAKLQATKVKLTVKAGAEGRLFGSVTSADLVAAVEEQFGVTLERKRVHLDEPIKALGTHEVPVRLHPEVEFRLPVEVVPA